jgi:hypothetical protein
MWATEKFAIKSVSFMSYTYLFLAFEAGLSKTQSEVVNITQASSSIIQFLVQLIFGNS